MIARDWISAEFPGDVEPGVGFQGTPRTAHRYRWCRLQFSRRVKYHVRTFLTIMNRLKMHTSRIIGPLIALFTSIIVTDCGRSDYFEKVTGIEFPESIETIEIVDNAEFYTIGKFIITNTKDIQCLIRNNGFVRLENDQKPVLLFSDSLKKPNRIIHGSNEPYCISGKSKTNRWNALLYKDTGEFWIEIAYPDHSGDNP
jgi:hypothetical protein